MQVTSKDIECMVECIREIFGGGSVNLYYDFWIHGDGKKYSAWKLYLQKPNDRYSFKTWEQLRAWVHGQDTKDTVLIDQVGKNEGGGRLTRLHNRAGLLNVGQRKTQGGEGQRGAY